MTTAVLYHSGCPDGFTAAWVAHNALKAEGKEPVMHPVSHGNPPPDLSGVDEVYILDFSYPHEVLVEMTDDGNRRVVVLDHHQSAIDQITDGLGYDPRKFEALGSFAPAPYEVELDTDRSGAGIAWDYFHDPDTRPAVVSYVEDRDLWRWKLFDSKAVNAFIKAQPHTLEDWDRLAEMPLRDMGTRGRGVLLQVDAYCRAAASHAYICEMGDRTFPIVNVTYESCSDVANYMLDKFDTDMSGYFFQRADQLWQYGFRSRNGVTVHDFAKQFGGGGHPQASGCQVPELVHRKVES